MKWKPYLLPLLMVALLSAIYFLPKQKEMAPSAIAMELPSECGGWYFQTKPPSQEEIDLLADDTKFAKAICLRQRPGEYDYIRDVSIPDRIDLSVVFSGHDLNNSIHRPERCMPSQGHVIGSSTKLILELPNGQFIPVRRLLSVQSIPTNEEHTEFASYNSVTYYFFVGNKTITEDHMKRTLIDIKDRLLFGMDQRWAYVSASMWYGKVPWIEKEVPIEEADRKLQEFIKEFTEEQIDWTQVR